MTDVLLPLAAVLVVAGDLLGLVLLTMALLSRLGHERLQRWMFR